MSLSSAMQALLRTEKQSSRLFLGFYTPKTVFACQINDTFATTDMILEFEYDGVTTGVYTDVLPDQVVYIGSAPGWYDLGIGRVRKALGATTFYIGEVSDISFADDVYVTVVDAMEINPRHPIINSEEVYMDGDIDYSDQHANFDPVPVMGGNAVLDVDTYPVSVDFPDVANCYVVDGSGIASTSLSATDGVVTNGTTSNPTLTVSSYPTNGYIRVALLVTASNGATFTGYRFVLVFDPDHRPIEDFVLESNEEDMESGGSYASITLNDENDFDSVRNRSLAILFSRDYFNGSQDVVGMETDRENIWISGWVYKQTDRDDPEFNPRQIEIYTADQWMNNMWAFITGVEIIVGTPTAWTNIASLTLDKGLWHFLHWRTTATRIMDVYLTDDSKYTASCESAAGSIWQQIVEMAGNQIMAVPFCDKHSRLFVKVPFNLIPEADRAAVEDPVMDLATSDYIQSTEIEWVVPSVSQINMSGVTVDISGKGFALYSLSPGHTPSRLGSVEVRDRLLLEDQSQANSLAGLLYAYRNNPYPDIPVTLLGNNRAFSLAPYRTATIDLYEYYGTIIPTYIERTFDHENGKVEIYISFEAETSEAISVNGDIPLGDDTLDLSNLPPLPPLPPLPDIAPIGGLIDDDQLSLGPSKVLIHTTDYGFIYSLNFDEASPNWHFMNTGLTTDQYQNLSGMVKTASGAIFAVVGTSATGRGKGTDLVWCEGLGGVWSVLHTQLSGGIVGLGKNPDASETIIMVDGSAGAMRSFIGNRSGVTQVATGIDWDVYWGDLIWLGDGWIAQHAEDNIFGSQAWSSFDGDGNVLVNTDNPDTGQAYGASAHHACGGGGYIYAWNNDARYLRTYTDLTTDDSDTTMPNVGSLGVSAKDVITCSPSGQYLMGGKSTVIGQRSSDFGVTWGNVGATLGIGYDVWENCDADLAFIAGTAQSVKYTGDWGTTWMDKSGDLATLASLCDPDSILFYAW